MDANGVLERLSALGVSVTPRPNGNLWLEPASVIPPDLVEEVRLHKQELMALLSGCHNPFTPHAAHEYPWECNPSTCDCYRLFGEPRWCQGIPCRWVWPTS